MPEVKAIGAGGYGVDPYNADYAYYQMMANKSYFGKTGDNPLLHVIVSFDDSVTDADTARKMTEQCAGYYTSDYQVLYCTHEKERGCSHYHGHILINSVGYNNGRMINSSVGNMYQFCEHVARVTGQKYRLYFEE